MSFFAKLEAAASRNDTLLCVGLDPTPQACPARYRASQFPSGNGNESHPVPACDALLTWNRAVIEATSDLACCYKPNIAFYEALGQPGMALLRRTIAAIPKEIPVLLDAKRGDIGSTAAAYARACFDELGVDAVTLSPYLGQDSISPFAAYEDKGLFILCHTSNASSADFQGLCLSRGQDIEEDSPLYLRVAQQALRWSPAIGLVVGATYPQALAQVRSCAPDRWILAPGVGAQGADLDAALSAGMRRDGLGLLIPSSRSIAQAEEPRQAAEELRQRINATRAQIVGREKGESATPTSGSLLPATLPSSSLDRLIIGLADLGALQFGDFTLASGKRSSVYVDLRLLVSQPDLMRKAAIAYGAKLASLPCDRIAGIPYAALPIGAAVSLASGIPLIYNRKEAKRHGLGKDIEGLWQPGERVVIIEDVITTGGSIVNSVELFRAAGLVVEDAVVLLDRQQGGVENLGEIGIRVHSVLGFEQVLEFLAKTGHIPAEIRQKLTSPDADSSTPL